VSGDTCRYCFVISVAAHQVGYTPSPYSNRAITSAYKLEARHVVLHVLDVAPAAASAPIARAHSHHPVGVGQVLLTTGCISVNRCVRKGPSEVRLRDLSVVRRCARYARPSDVVPSFAVRGPSRDHWGLRCGAAVVTNPDCIPRLGDRRVIPSRNRCVESCISHGEVCGVACEAWAE
jgi:hypothetical protein